MGLDLGRIRPGPGESIVAHDDGHVEWNDPRFPLLFIALGLLAAAGVASAPGDRSPVFAVVLVLVAVSPWALSLIDRTPPDPVFVAFVLVPIGALLVGGEELGLVDLDGGAPQLVLMLVIGLVGQVAVVGSTRAVVTVTALAAAIVAAGAIVRGDPLDFGPWWVGIVLAVGGGRSFRASIVRLVELRAAQAALTERELADERRRIAREVHDIVAHTMSVTMLHLTAARLALVRDPDAAEEALLEAERHGRASMDDIRRVVRLLRADESSLAEALPDDADLPALIERYRRAGSDVSFARQGEPAGLAPTSRLVVYRVVQESLSNVVRHGGGAVDVRVAHGDDSTELDVVNDIVDGGPWQPGSGLIGMRERVESLGGTVDAGPDPSTGRWRVRARIPS